MAFKIPASECLGCGVCAQDCPANAIYQDGDVFAINPDICIDCGTCLNLCPVQAPRKSD